MKLECVTNKICSIAPHDIQENILLPENKARADIVLEKCKEYVNTADNLSQSGSSTSAIDEFFDDVPYFRENDSKGANHSVYSRISSRSSNAGSSERQYNATEAKLYALQVEAESKRVTETKKRTRRGGSFSGNNSSPREIENSRDD